MPRSPRFSCVHVINQIAFVCTIVYGIILSALRLQETGCEGNQKPHLFTTKEQLPESRSRTGHRFVSVSSPDNNVLKDHDHEIPFVKPPLFNPWRDFRFSPVSNQTYYSSHSCVAAASTERRKDHVSRTCHYQNLYYHIPTKKWHYFPNPLEKQVFQKEPHRLNQMDVTIWHVRESFEGQLVDRISAPYRPQVHLLNDHLNDINELLQEGTMSKQRESNSDTTPRVVPSHANAAPTEYLRPPSNQTVILSTVHDEIPVFVMYQGSMANFGHFIWDDYLSVYSQLDLLDLADDDRIMPIPFVQDQRLGGSFCCSDNGYTYDQCTKFMKRLYPSLWNLDTDCSGDVVRTGNWLQGSQAIGRWDRHLRVPCDDYRDNITNKIDAEFVIVPNVTVGSGRLALFSCYGDCTLGRGPQLFRFRNYLVRRMLGHTHATNPKGYITFSLAHGANRGRGEVTLFEKEIEAATDRYGQDVVKAVNLANMTLEEQAELISNSAVLFTNHGGGSASTIFLPKGASAFVYWSQQQRDIEFYRSVAYFRTEWIEERSRQYVPRTMQLLEMQLAKTASLYPNMICLEKHVME